MSTTRVPSRPAMAFQSSGASLPGSSWPVTMVRAEATFLWVTGIPAISGAAMLLASAARGGQGTVAQAVMVRQLLRLTQAVYDASVAAGQARQARLLAEDTRARLVRLREALPAPAAVGAATPAGTPSTSPKLDPEAQAVLDRLRAGQAHDATRAASPLPSKIEPAKRAETIRPGADRGPER